MVYGTTTNGTYRDPSNKVPSIMQTITTNVILRGFQYHGNPNQMCFLARKVDGEELDQLGQYLKSRDSLEFIRAKERICGHNWLSTGGEFTTRVRQRFLLIRYQAVFLKSPLVRFS